MRTTRLALLTGAGALAAAGATAACNAVIGLDGYSTHAISLDGGHPETAADASTDGAASCDVDLTIQCYACVPTETSQFLNACTNSTCVPFDDVARLAHGLSDGGLPPLPPVDSGSN